jgi:hypothetical protein
MIYEHPCHIKVEDTAVLWRYMSLCKYLSLLKEQALFFCRADKFSDPHECSIPKKEFEYRTSPDKFEEEARAFRIAPRKYDLQYAKDRADKSAEVHKNVKYATTVNCWHINTMESDAMWRIYLKDNEGVAIRTNKKRLNKVLSHAKEEIGVSKVRYLDYENDIFFHETDYPENRYNYLIPIFHKRNEFKHEEELRLYHHNFERENKGFWDSQPNEKGEFIKIDVCELIECVIFPPTTDKKTQEKIVKLTKEYGFDFNFKESQLSTQPYY